MSCRVPALSPWAEKSIVTIVTVTLLPDYGKVLTKGTVAARVRKGRGKEKGKGKGKGKVCARLLRLDIIGYRNHRLARELPLVIIV